MFNYIKIKTSIQQKKLLKKKTSHRLGEDATTYE